MSEALDRVYTTPAILLAAELTENETVIRRLTSERDALAEQVRSLTVERDQARKLVAEPLHPGVAIPEGRVLHFHREACGIGSGCAGDPCTCGCAPCLLALNLAHARAERDAALARLSRAREALDRYDEDPPHYRAGLDEENAWRARQEAALAALRAALTEETAPRE